MLYIPKEITKDIETGLETASFSYYDGIQVAKLLNLEQSTNFSDLRNGTHFIVCCGDVMLKCTNNDYKNITRREF